MFVLKHWIFFEDISNFTKWKSFIIDKKWWMLRDAMLSKGSNNFATKVISTENVEKIVKEVRKKNQTYFFLSFKATSLKVTISGKILYLKNLNKGSSSS